MDWTELALEVTYILLPLVATLIGVLIGLAVNYIYVLTDKVKSENARSMLNSAIAEAELVAIDAVYAVQQKLVDDLKETHADGKLTKDEIATIQREALEYFLSHLSEASRRVLLNSVESLKDWAQDLIEAKLGQYRQSETERTIRGLADPLLSGAEK